MNVMYVAKVVSSEALMCIEFVLSGCVRKFTASPSVVTVDNLTVV